MIRGAALGLLLAGCATHGPTCPETVAVIQRVPVPVHPDAAELAACHKPVPAEVSARAYKQAYDEAIQSIDECNARLARARKGQ